jgi:hypothetical protein
MAVAIDYQPRITLVDKRGSKNSGKLAANPKIPISMPMPVQLRLGQSVAARRAAPDYRVIGNQQH